MSNVKWESLPCITVNCLIGCRANTLGNTGFISGGINDVNEDNDCANYCSSFRIVDLVKNTLKNINPPQSIGFYGHDTCITPNNTILISGETNAFDIKYVKGDHMENKFFHTLNFFPKLNSFLLFGGKTISDNISNDLLSITMDSYTCKNEKWDGEWPPGLCNHSSSVIDGKLYIFGGESKFGPSNELWCLDIMNHTWVKIEPTGNLPEPRYNHICIVLGKLLFIGGGMNAFGALSDCHIFHTGTNKWHTCPSSIDIPHKSEYYTATLIKNKLCLFSPDSNWYINPRELVNYVLEKKEQMLLIPVSKIDSLQQKINHVISLLEKTTEKYNQISGLLEMERIVLDISQDVGECKKLLVPEQKKKNTPPPKVPNKNTNPPGRNVQGSNVRGRGNNRGKLRRSISAIDKAKTKGTLLEKAIEQNNAPNTDSVPRRPNSNNNNSNKPTKPIPRIPNKPHNNSPSPKLLSKSVTSTTVSHNKNRNQTPTVPQRRPTPKRQIHPNTVTSPLAPISSDSQTTDTQSTLNEEKTNLQSSTFDKSKQLPKPPNNGSHSKSTLPPAIPAKSVVSFDNENTTYFKEGSVWKRKITKNVLSKWKFRYFKLCQNIIYYYINPGDTSPIGQIDLGVTTVRRISPNDEDVHIKDGRLWCMLFSTFGTTYHIAVDTQKELEEWLEILKKVELQYYNPSNNPKPRKPKPNLFHTLKKKSTMSFDLSSPSDRPLFTRNDSIQAETAPPISSCTQREAILNEILSTERDYVSDLLIITDFYIKRLQDFKILKKDFKDIIFANVEDLVPLHQEFLSKLEKENENESPMFSKIFIEEVPKWSAYTHFCTSQSNSKEEITKYCEKNHNFEMCLEELKNQPECRKLDLASYLIKPMQRICKYPLLLKELKKETPDTHEEFSQLSEAITIVSNILVKVNENKREADNVIELLQLQESITDLNVNIHSKGQKIVKKQIFKKVQYDVNKEASKHTIWLLNDILLVAKKVSKNKYTLRLSMPVEAMIVWDLDDANSPEHKNALSIFRTDKRNVKVIISTNSIEEKREWIDLLNERIADIGFVGK